MHVRRDQTRIKVERAAQRGACAPVVTEFGCEHRLEKMRTRVHPILGEQPGAGLQRRLKLPLVRKPPCAPEGVKSRVRRGLARIGWAQPGNDGRCRAGRRCQSRSGARAAGRGWRQGPRGLRRAGRGNWPGNFSQRLDARRGRLSVDRRLRMHFQCERCGAVLPELTVRGHENGAGTHAGCQLGCGGTDRVWLKVDEDVATEDQVDVRRACGEARECVVNDIDAGVADHLPDGGPERPHVAISLEIGPPERRVAASERPFAIGGALSALQDLAADVGCQDIDVPIRKIRQELAQQNGNRRRLLARGTTATPDLERKLATCATRGDEVGQNPMAQKRHLACVAHEESFVRCQDFCQGAAFFGPTTSPGPEHIDKLRLAREPVRAHALGDVPLKRRVVNRAHVQTGDLANLPDDFSGVHVNRSMPKQK